MKKFIITLISLIVLLISLIVLLPVAGYGHENDKFKHKNMGPCYGWGDGGAGMRLCFKEKDSKNWCTYLIYNHEMWHVSDEFFCTPAVPTEEEE